MVTVKIDCMAWCNGTIWFNLIAHAVLLLRVAVDMCQLHHIKCLLKSTVYIMNIMSRCSYILAIHLKLTTIYRSYEKHITPLYGASISLADVTKALLKYLQTLQ